MKSLKMSEHFGKSSRFSRFLQMLGDVRIVSKLVSNQVSKLVSYLVLVSKFNLVKSWKMLKILGKCL